MEPNTQQATTQDKSKQQTHGGSQRIEDLHEPYSDPGKPTGGGPTPMRIRRFLFGMLIAAGGIALMLIVAFGMLQGWGIHKDLSLPAIGLCMILGLMMLGGGFGVMATAAGTFDDDEFDRLMAGEKRELDDGEYQRDSQLPRVQKAPPISSRLGSLPVVDRLQNP